MYDYAAANEKYDFRNLTQQQQQQFVAILCEGVGMLWQLCFFMQKRAQNQTYSFHFFWLQLKKKGEKTIKLNCMRVDFVLTPPLFFFFLFENRILVILLRFPFLSLDSTSSSSPLTSNDDRNYSTNQLTTQVSSIV